MKDGVLVAGGVAAQTAQAVENVKAQLATIGAAPVLRSSPAEFSRFIDSEIGKWRKVISEAKIPQQ